MHLFHFLYSSPSAQSAWLCFERNVQDGEKPKGPFSQMYTVCVSTPLGSENKGRLFPWTYVVLRRPFIQWDNWPCLAVSLFSLPQCVLALIYVLPEGNFEGCTGQELKVYDNSFSILEENIF